MPEIILLQLLSRASRCGRMDLDYVIHYLEGGDPNIRQTFRSGVLLTPITAKLIGEFIAEKTPSVAWEKFSPMRFQAANETARVSGAPR